MFALARAPNINKIQKWATKYDLLLVRKLTAAGLLPTDLTTLFWSVFAAVRFVLKHGKLGSNSRNYNKLTKQGMYTNFENK
jgi:hypothetical protein